MQSAQLVQSDLVASVVSVPDIWAYERDAARSGSFLCLLVVLGPISFWLECWCGLVQIIMALANFLRAVVQLIIDEYRSMLVVLPKHVQDEHNQICSVCVRRRLHT